MKYIVLTLVLLIASKAEAAKIVCLGDSNTVGYGASYSYCDLIGGVKVATGGHSSREAKERVGEVLSYRPKTVIVMIGTGDAYDPDGDGLSRITLEEYQANLKAIIKPLKRRKIRVILLTPLCTQQQSFNALLKPYVLANRAIAKRAKLESVENYTPCAEDLIEGVQIFSDYAHLTDLGQSLLAVRVQKVLNKKRGK